MNYKPSIYNVKMLIDKVYYVYNTLYGSCLTYSAFNQLVHTDLPKLIDLHMMIPCDIDEYALTQVLFNKAVHSVSECSFFIAPTMACDFNCPYCYAPHEAIMMTEKTAEQVVKFIEVASEKADSVSISWVGGEPLLNWNRIRQINEKLLFSFKGKHFSSTVVTNGYYLSNTICDTLIYCGVDTFVITVDGNAEIHDNRRFKGNGEKTFYKIIENIASASRKNITTVIRMNVDCDNVSYIVPLIHFLKSEGILERTYLSLVPVKQFDSKNNYTRVHIVDSQIEQKITDATIYDHVIWGGPDPYLHCCPGVKLFDYSIGPEGELYACPIGIGRDSSVIGNIFQLFPSSEYYSWYSFIGKENKSQCRQCSYYPLCLSSCRWISRNNAGIGRTCASEIKDFRSSIKNYILRSIHEYTIN